MVQWAGLSSDIRSFWVMAERIWGYFQACFLAANGFPFELVPLLFDAGEDSQPTLKLQKIGPWPDCHGTNNTRDHEATLPKPPSIYLPSMSWIRVGTAASLG